eukprot:TRINITY_DN49640_c0_g1_i1.p1 TRINITY_DN49640_c0_g1~~TRINITY_DN49640_c0_g1_i1.p1  ORF type:complete len:423 (-),score=63.74 TRINITY_DN49640_c0_g1_i1:11-1279(-)
MSAAMANFSYFLFFVLLCAHVASEKEYAGWTCGDDGFWYQDGAKTEYANCGDKQKDSNGDKDKGNDKPVKSSCTVTEQSSVAIENLTRTCIKHSSNPSGRCWWTHVPNAVANASDGRKVPLIVDMHGGGGCASFRFETSGFKTLSDSEAAKAGGGVIVVWPQGGPGSLWASHGTSTRQTDSKTKSLAEWDDISFLEQLLASMVLSSPHKDKIDVERIYMSGFSLGCMMAHRFSMERSAIVAALGCHGGELSFFPTNQAEMDADKSTYNIQPMPAYLSIGDNDVWFPGAKSSWQAWTYWNGCSENGTTTLAADLNEHVASSCANYTPALETVMLEIKGGEHVPSVRATEKTWSFLKQYRRAGVLAQLPATPPPVTSAISSATTASAAISSAPTASASSASRRFPLVNMLGAMLAIGWLTDSTT